jgi:alkaline phosphatase D
MSTYDWGSMYTERAEILDAVRDAGITGFAIVAGDRHAFWAGYAAKRYHPPPSSPWASASLGGSLISPGMAEANEHNQKKENNPTRPLYITEVSGKPQPTAHLMLHHGVRSALEYAASGDLQKALAVRNPDLAPHLTFVDLGGHGYATVRVDATGW